MKTVRSEKQRWPDADGQFTLRGLIDGATKLNAHAMDIREKSNQSILLDCDINVLEVRLKEISLTSKPKVVTVLGMQLTDLTAELRSVYDQYEPGGEFRPRLKRKFQTPGVWPACRRQLFSSRRTKTLSKVYANSSSKSSPETANQNGDTLIVDVVYSFNSLEYHTNATTQTKRLHLTTSKSYDAC